MGECAYNKKCKPQTHSKNLAPFSFLFRNVSELLHLILQKKRDPYGFINLAKLEPGCLTLLRKLTIVKKRDTWGWSR
jgi:hypothetical protein